jgi:hypothetical protein
LELYNRDHIKPFRYGHGQTFRDHTKPFRNGHGQTFIQLNELNFIQCYGYRDTRTIQNPLGMVMVMIYFFNLANISYIVSTSQFSINPSSLRNSLL